MEEYASSGPRRGFYPGQGTAAANMERSFTGTIERVIFQNRENGYAVFSVRPEVADAGRNGIPQSSFTCVGSFLNPQEGLRLRFNGRFVTNQRFGRQFAFTSAVEQIPETEEGLVSYLSCGLIKGVGPMTARRLVETFGREVMRVLDEQPHLIASVPGIGEKRAAGIIESWNEHRGMSDLMRFLQPHGISPAYGARIFAEYGASALRIVRENPYRLAMDVRGIGFATADAMAEKLGVPKDSPLRARGAVLYILQKAAESGDVFLPLSELMTRAEKELCLVAEAVPDAIQDLQDERRIVVDENELTPGEGTSLEGDKAVYLTNSFKCEARTAFYLDRLQRKPANVTFPDAEAAVRMALEAQEHSLAPAQADAVRLAARSKVMVLTGGPGTGKTTIIKAIISLYRRKTDRIYLAAPTGRAAKRMTEATGMEARTLHRLLEFQPQTGSFARDEEEPLACDLLIVDEASMMDIVIFYHLMKAVPTGCVVIFVGDIHQLPSVGPGTVLADIIDSGRVPVAELTEIFRQARTSGIVSGAHQINAGIVPAVPSPWEARTDFFFLRAQDAEAAAHEIARLVSREIPERFGFDPLTEIQLLVPMHRGPVGTQNMNVLLQDALNPLCPDDVTLRRGETTYREGDKVMQVRNNYEKDVFNGDIGTVRVIDREGSLVTVLFDDREVAYQINELDELVLAYAVSIHKSQGSEYPVVVIPLFSLHWVMLQRNLIYTAITRGKKLVVLVGDQTAFVRAVTNANVKQRYTRLRSRLQGFTG